MTIKNRLIIPSEILEMFLKPNNDRDIFLTKWSDIGKSKIYKNKDGIYFDYNVSFYLHLEKIDDTHTKVSITAIKPKIVVGREFLPSPPHMVRRNKTIEIEPSTIEEYEILLAIGDLLHERNMPDILLPNEKSKIEIIIKSKTKN